MLWRSPFLLLPCLAAAWAWPLATCFAEPVHSGAVWRHRFTSNAPVLLLGLLTAILLYAYLAVVDGLGWTRAWWFLLVQMVSGSYGIAGPLAVMFLVASFLVLLSAKRMRVVPIETLDVTDELSLLEPPPPRGRRRKRSRRRLRCRPGADRGRQLRVTLCGTSALDGGPTPQAGRGRAPFACRFASPRNPRGPLRSPRTLAPAQVSGAASTLEVPAAPEDDREPSEITKAMTMVSVKAWRVVLERAASRSSRSTRRRWSGWPG